MTFSDIANLVCKELPEDWELVISLTNGCGAINLYNPEGEDVPDAYNFDDEFEAQVLEAVGYAKANASNFDPI